MSYDYTKRGKHMTRKRYKLTVLGVTEISVAANIGATCCTMQKNVSCQSGHKFFFKLIRITNVRLNQQKQPTRCKIAIEFIIPTFIKGSTCFERHTAHNQELQILFAASGLYTHVVTGRCPGWVETVPTQPGQRPVTA
jgi:hypothetical protein